jgi:hypothetical protein
MALFLHKWLLLLLVAALPGRQTFSKAHAHPFYVSVVELAHNKEAASLEISCKVFAEDAQAVLEKQYKSPVDFNDARQKERLNGLLSEYIQKHLAVTTDEKAQRLRFVGFEQESESLYCYFEVTGVPAVKSIRLTNSLLHDFTEKQINIMHVMVNGARKSYKLDYPATDALFSF